MRKAPRLPALLLALPTLAAASGAPPVGTAPGPRLLLTQVPLHASARPGVEDDDLAPGSRVALFDPSKPAGATSLTRDFVAAGRPSLSPDARRFLFVGRKRVADPLAIWEMEVDGGRLRRVAGCEGNCTRAIYAAALYTIDAGAPVPAIVHSALPRGVRERSGGARPSLFATDEDGSHPRRITFDPRGASHPLLLRDGRIVYSAGTGAGGCHGAALFTVLSDGTDVFPFTAPPPPVRQSMACESERGEVLFVESESYDSLGGGALVAVPRTTSRAARRTVRGTTEGRFHSPSPLPDGGFVVAFRAAGGRSYGIYRLDEGEPPRFAPIFDAPDRHDLDPVAVVPRRPPAGRSSAVDERSHEGALYGLDAYRHGDSTDLGDPSRAPVAYLRLFRASSGTAADDGGVLLGRVPVESDGSFHVRVPARTPLRLETVDAEGRALRTMRSWIWVMPNESRGCIGCHEDRDLAPPQSPRARAAEAAALARGGRPAVTIAKVALAAVALVAPIAATGGSASDAAPPRYAGAAACSACHRPGGEGAPCPAEGAQAHPRAFGALLRPEAAHVAYLSGEKGPPSESLLCLGCHATGAEEGARWHAPEFRLGDGVQCEACHGPRSDHARAPRAPRPAALPAPSLALSPKEELCRSCHLPRPSHRAVADAGYRRPEADLRYRSPVSLATSPSGYLYVAAERSDHLLVVDPVAGRVVSEFAVDRSPHDVAVAPDGKTLYVTSRIAGTVSAIDAASGKLLARATVGAEPHGIRIDRAGKRLFVLVTGDDAIVALDAATLAVSAHAAAGTGPWGAALRSDGKALAATSVRPSPAPFREPHRSEITLVDPVSARVAARIAVPDANTLQAIAFVPGNDVALFPLMRTKDLVPMTRLAQGWVVTNGLGVLWPDGRVDQVLLDDPADSFPDPTGIAIRPDGRFALVTSAGSDRVAVVDVRALLDLLAATPDERRASDLPNRLGTSARFVVRRIPVGRNPRSVVFSPDGKLAYVAATLDDAITVIDGNDFSVRGVIPLGGPAEVTETRRGERLFHSAASAFGRQFSCRSCHPDGHTNGLALDIEADGIGLRPLDVRSLRGVFDTPPFKWDGSNPSLARQCGPRLSVFFSRLDPPTSDDLSALVRYVATIEHPANPRRPADGLTPAQRRGKGIFERQTDNRGRAIPPAGRCVHCHGGPYRASLRSSGVGTDMWFDAPALDDTVADLRNDDPLGPLGIVYFSQDPSRLRPLDDAHLRGIRSSPPYLHNGAAATLEEIWTRFNLYEWHGVTNDLTREQFNDLIEYLESL